MIHAIVMAGGSGTRFWPKSTLKTPKQFLKLFGDRTLFQSTFDRLGELVPEANRMVVTNERYSEEVSRQLPYLTGSNIITEPVPRNTGPCIAAAAQLLHNRDPDAVMIVLPADHYIGDHARFRENLSIAVDVADRNRSLVTIGIRPDRPETGYGYIRYTETSSGEGISKACPVEQFTEKPDREKALSFLKSGNFLWNSGMFVWRADVILEAFRKHQPEIYRQLDPLSHTESGQERIDEFYRSVSSISIDYGIMEHSSNVEVIPGDFGWSDVGSWEAVHQLADKDENGNSVSGANVLSIDSKRNMVEGETGRLIAIVGVENLAVVETGEAILVCDLDNSQKVREVVDLLKENEKLNRYL